MNRPLSEESEQRYSKLREIISTFPGAVVAFSGGVDSLLLLHAAVESLGRENIRAVIGLSPTLPLGELRDARRLTGKLGVELIELETGVMEIPEFTSNPSDRCYHCRKRLNTLLKSVCREGWAVFDGASLSDLGDYRPGLRAADEAGVRHPLIEAGIRKKDVRAILRALCYPKEVYSRPSSPCLSSRIPYGEEITPEKLGRIEAGEEFLRTEGFRELRVRHYIIQGRPAAVVELGKRESAGLTPDRMNEIAEGLSGAGFRRVFLDLQGLRSGNLNDALVGEKGGKSWTRSREKETENRSWNEETENRVNKKRTENRGLNTGMEKAMGNPADEKKKKDVGK